MSEEASIKNHGNASIAITTDTSDAPNLVACTSETLFRWLLVNRFNNNEQAVRTFLSQAASTLTATTSTVSPAAKDDSAAPPAASSSTDFGESLCLDPVEVSCTTPRGKFQFNFLQKGIECTDKNGNCMKIPAGAVQYCVIFPKPEDCQPVTQRKGKGAVVTDQVLLVFGAGSDSDSKSNVVTYKNPKALSQVCLALPADLPVWKNNDSDDDDDDDWTGLDHTDQYTRFLAKSLSLDMATQIIRVANPAAPALDNNNSTFWRYQFVSHQEQGTSTTTGGMPFVKCYAGVNDGVLYPLAEGLLFYKPPRFVPRSNLQAIACGRGGSNASRYVDMVLTLADDKSTNMEFTNIHRGELAVLREYIQGCLIPAMQKDADGGADADAKDECEESPAQQLEEDEDEEETQSVPAGRPRPGKRKASVEARAVTQRMRLESDDDEEGDGDFVEEHDSDDEDEDSEEDSGDDDEVEADDDDDDDDDDEVEVEADEATDSEDE
jgi:hypothetical protein